MSESGRRSGFSSWIVIISVVVIIIGITAIFVYFNQPERYPPPPAGWSTIRPPYATLALAEQSDVIWAGGAEGVYAIDQSTGKLGIAPAELARITYVRDLCVDKNGALWIAHDKGLTRYVNGQIRTFTAAELPDGYCGAVLEDSKGNIWAGTETGIAIFNGEVWRDFTGESGFGKIPISMIFEDSEGVIWFGSDSVNLVGLMRYDGKEWRSFSVDTGLVAHNTISDIFEDDEGNLWVASGIGSHGGATCIKQNTVDTFTMEDGLMGPRVRSLYQDRLGRFWFGSEFEGSAVFDGGKRFFLTPDQGLAGWEVMEMLEDSAGVLWLATENGITRIESVDAVNGKLGIYDAK